MDPTTIAVATMADLSSVGIILDHVACTCGPLLLSQCDHLHHGGFVGVLSPECRISSPSFSRPRSAFSRVRRPFALPPPETVGSAFQVLVGRQSLIPEHGGRHRWLMPVILRWCYQLGAGGCGARWAHSGGARDAREKVWLRIQVTEAGLLHSVPGLPAHLGWYA